MFESKLYAMTSDEFKVSLIFVPQMVIFGCYSADVWSITQLNWCEFMDVVTLHVNIRFLSAEILFL